MRFKYLLYPEAKERIANSDLGDKIKKLIANHDDPFPIGSLMDGEVVERVNELKERGYIATLPKRTAEKFKTKMQELFKYKDAHFWKVNRFDGSVKGEVDLEDILFMIGDPASLVLKPNEIWKFKKYGFKSLTDFTGSIAAYMNGSSGLFSKPGYTWERKLSDGRILVNEITGSHHADLRIFQTDVTPYETFDPIGNKVSYRPEFDEDRRSVSGYHSTEGQLLAGILKYVEQTKTPSQFLDKTKGLFKLLDWAKSLGQGGGTCTEHFGGFDQHPMLFFSTHDIPIPVLDKDYSTKEITNYGIRTEFGGHYGLFIGPNKEIVFSGFGKDKSKPAQKVAAMFQPEDADHFVKGLIYQSANGLGRTSARQLIGLLEYRFSDQFDKDQAETKERVAKYSK